MRKLIAFLFSVLLIAGNAQAGITYASAQSYTYSSGYIGGTLPLTVGAWIFPTTLGAENRIFLSGKSGSGGWDISLCGSACSCGSNGDLHFAKISSADVCSTQLLSTNAWTYVAAVVSSTQVHFFVMTASGTVTTQNVSDTHSINNPTSPITEESDNSTSAFVGTIAQAEAWIGSSLSDTELKAAAYGGPQAVGRTVSLYYPTFGINTTFGLGNMAAGNPLFVLGHFGTPSTGSHCPCGNPFGGN